MPFLVPADQKGPPGRLKWPTRSIVVIRVQLMVEIFSESLVRAIGKVLLMKFS